MPQCAFCEKEYRNRTYLARHERICAFIHHRRIREDVAEPLPSVRQLYEVVLHLVEENNRLKNKVARLTVKEQREWSLEEALGSAVPPQTFREWSKTLTATRSHLEAVFEHGRVEGISRMVTEMVSAAAANTNILPVRAFPQRKHAVYAYGENGKWSRLDNNDWQLFLNTLDKALRTQFAKWQQEHSEQLFEPTFQELLVANMNKLNTKTRGDEATKLKRVIYDRIINPPH